MLSFILKIWQRISYNGIDQVNEDNFVEQKRRIFFNQSIALGFFSILSLMIFLLPIIGNYSYLNLIGAGAIIIGFWLNAKGKYAMAKIIVVYSIFSMATFLTTICGKDFLYHTGAITLLTFAWVQFDLGKNRTHLLIFSIFTAFTYTIGEFNLFHAPIYIDSTDLLVLRIANLIMFTTLVIVFISFILRINSQFEAKLSSSVKEKQVLLSELTVKTRELEREQLELEDIIQSRTAELQQQKSELIAQNAEKEVLLKEIHHRVKNNLQIIVSLLNLQAANFEDEKFLHSIQETQNRIIAMSLVHQRMYQTTDFVAIEFKDYISSLFENNELFYNAQAYDVNFQNNTSPLLKIDIETSIPLGLIINELITNAFKHAFSISNEKHTLMIEITEHSANNYSFLYRDNGPGILESELNMTKTMGLQLVEALVEQINGKLMIVSKDGLNVSFNFHN
jgi:two-component sensor histidine kinase